LGWDSEDKWPFKYKCPFTGLSEGERRSIRVFVLLERFLMRGPRTEASSLDLLGVWVFPKPSRGVSMSVPLVSRDAAASLL
jgi:hypothetical protein